MTSPPHTLIIGAGIGGLTTAALLRQAGHRVTVLEAHVYPGGSAGAFYHKKYRFDAGATLAGGFAPGGPHARVATQLGLAWPVTPVDPAWMVHLPDGRSITQWTDAERWRAERQAAFPGTESFWRTQEKLAEISWDISSRPFPWPPESAHTAIVPWWRLRHGDDEAAYLDRREAYRERLLTAAATAVPSLQNAIELCLPGTPVTFAFYTRRPQGMVGGFGQESIFRARGPSTGVPNLWLVGDSIFPGQSTAGVTLGGLRVAAVVERVSQQRRPFRLALPSLSWKAAFSLPYLEATAAAASMMMMMGIEKRPLPLTMIISPAAW